MELTHENKNQSPDELLYQGSCLCSASQYSIIGQPIQAVICHCINCKKWSGGAFAANVWIPKDYFKLDQASSESIAKYADSNTDAGKTLYRAFCGRCGSSLFVDVPSYGLVAVTRGTLDVAEEIGTLDPAVEFYCSRKLPWAAITAKTKQRQKLG